MDNIKHDFELIVIGGGPAGVTAALRAAELGAQVALIERGRMGGTCTNDGCVPTRVLAKAARLLRESAQFSEYGLTGANPDLDFEVLLSRTQQVVYSIQEKKQLIKNLNEKGVQVISGVGEGSFTSPNTIRTADGSQFSADKFIIAVGGRARRLPFPGAEHALTHSDIWSLKSLPGSAVIIGSAATGSQLASIFDGFGSKVHLLDISPTLLPTEDIAIQTAMQTAFESRGIQIYNGIQGVEQITQVEDQFKVNFVWKGDERLLVVDAVVFAVGWPGNIAQLGVDAAGVDTIGSYIRVDDDLQTSAPHIYAAGDITGRMMLVQSASYEARIAAENAVLGKCLHQHHQIVPHGGFTDPEYGSVGLTEEEAIALGKEYASATVPFSQLDRAIIDGRPEGLCKLIVDRKSRTLLGAHVVGEQALEIVHLVAAGMASEMTIDQLAGLEIAYPTFTAIVGLAARKLLAGLTGDAPFAQWRALDKVVLSEWEIQD